MHTHTQGSYRIQGYTYKDHMKLHKIHTHTHKSVGYSIRDIMTFKIF